MNIILLLLEYYEYYGRKVSLDIFLWEQTKLL